jgi:hypothetical protein
MKTEYPKNTSMSFSAGSVRASLSKHTGAAEVEMHVDEGARFGFHEFHKRAPNPEKGISGCHSFVTLKVKDDDKSTVTLFLSLEQVAELVEKGAELLTGSGDVLVKV